MKSHLRLGFLGSLFFHVGLIALLWFAFKEDKSANGITADEISTNISMEMLMATRVEAEPTPEPAKAVEPEKKETVADPTKPVEKLKEKEKEKPKPKEKPKEPPKEKAKPKVLEKKIMAKPEPNPNAVVAAKAQAGNANVNSQATALSKSANTNANMAGSGTNTSEIAAYKAKLHREIERHKKYSQRARMMRLQGVVTIAFNLGADGSLNNARVLKSSGKEELDNSALNAVNSAQSVGARPAGMSDTLSVPISFVIR